MAAMLAELEPSPAMRAFDARQDMKRSNPLLWLAYYCEAVGDRRIECDMNDPAILTAIGNQAREMIAAHLGEWDGNALYPERRRRS